MHSIGIDIGTTNLAIVVCDCSTHSIVHVDSVAHNATISGMPPDEHCQDAELLYRMVLSWLDEACTTFRDIGAIGITGQMHGILYLNGAGKPLSPLYTWMDRRAARLSEANVSFTEEIACYCPISTGYGIATHYTNMRQKRVPPDSGSIATIMGYVAMQLCDLRVPTCDPGCAASLGCYLFADADDSLGGFDHATLQRLGIDPSLLPRPVLPTTVIGHWKNIPVIAPMGDMQASFIGSVADMDTSLLVNIGTGAQIMQAIPRNYQAGNAPMEVRPFIGERALAVGATLTAGKAIEMFADLCADIYRGYAATLPQNKYAILDTLQQEMKRDVADTPAEDTMSEPPPLRVDTRFAGSRFDACDSGTIANITTANLGASELMQGFFAGIVAELYALWKYMEIDAPRSIVASGGAVKRNPLLRRIIASTWNSDILITDHRETTALGAALTAAVATGIIPSFDDTTDYITYRS